MPVTQIRTLRDARQKCRVRVRINGEEKEAHLLFGDGANERPIGDRVYLYPHGWFNTDEVEYLEVLTWVEPE